MAAWTTKGVTRQGVWVLAAAAVLVAAGALIPGAAAQHEGGVVSLPPPDDATVPEDPQEDTAAEVGGVGEDVGVSGEAERGDLTPGGGSREGHFSGGSARVVLPVTLSLRGYTSLSFRTCSHGTLLQQTGSGGDSLVLGVSEEGSLVLTLSQHGHAHTTTLARSLNDNAWHRVYLKFELGVLTLGVGQATVVVANSTHSSASLLDLALWSASPQLTIGRNFTGCLLQGAGTEFTSSFALHTGVQWDACPLPDGTDCTGYQEDPCFAQPCGRRGECVAAGDSYACNCYTRYEGEQCQNDTGPLCLRSEFQCANGGLCQEDRQGNTTTCACPTGYIGTTCQTPINENFCEADTHPCQNNATCTITAFSDSYECLCQPGYSGEHCEVNDDDCASQPCWNGGLCIDGTNDFSCNCDGTGYVGDVCQDNIDECSPMSPCLNGATCYDLYGSYECACIPGYGGKHCEMEVLECSSDPCQNGGTCTDLQNAYRCACLLGFEGDNCERNIDNCYNVTCPENSFCEDGVNEYVCRCSPGYSGSAPNCVEINECASSPCLNGATCYDDSNAYTCICGPGFSGRNCEVNIDDCAGAPCQHGGTCHDEVQAFTCECPAGFEGEHCEVNRDECALNVCVHATDCEDLIGDYTCHCEDGWAGKNCEDEVDECASSPCHNGASCKDRVNGFDCTCLPGFTGQTCETNIDECASTPCLNGGLCVDGVNNYTCECGEAFMGANCEEQYDACAAQPCHNGGSCITTRGDRSFYCECIPGFEGLYCSNNINDCFDVTCSDGKVCYDLVNSYECRCPEGFTGENCSVNIDECQSDPCLNGGECHDGRANYTCICPPGYTGHNCEEDVDECATQQPCINGICENTNGSYQCYCRPGFSGDHCNLEFDECLSHPCKNSGTCINRINGYECVCQPGFTGTDCDVDIDECESGPCQNNATCLDAIATFTCECLPGFTDQLCSTNIDECESDPCMNAGVCTDGINEFTCNCSATGFKGPQCEINIDDCESSPCQHGSTCSDLIKDYECVCHPGYQGKNCEEDIAECESVPCLNGATCLERSNLTLYDLGVFNNFTFEEAGGFECECVPGFEGERCEINIDECEDAPCKEGECVDGINTYSCMCWPGYEGDNCETEINECELYAPCVMGTCVDKIADYECVCEDGYGGKNCSVELLGCRGVECLNGGECQALLVLESDHDFKCRCPHGFTGRVCEDITTMSFAGASYAIMHSDREEGYALSFRFRTTLGSGILAVGQGETYIKLELLDGRLNVHSSLLNKWEGIFVGSDLNDGEWQSVQLTVNDSHVFLAANNQTTLYPINPVQTINSSDTSFSTTVIGGATPTLKILSKEAPFFTGCMENVVVDGVEVVPSRLLPQMRVQMDEGCPRVEQCSPNPCLNQGQCVDLWSSYKCNCERPFLGDTCQLSFTPVTFGNEDTKDSLVTVMIPEVDHNTYRTHADVSMMVRTREPNGLIFYLGTHYGPAFTGVEESYILAELVQGRLVLRVLLGGHQEELFTVPDVSLVDGESHLLRVTRVNLELEVSVDRSLVLNTTLQHGGDLLAHVLYLGGVPGDSTRVKRQLGVSNFTTTVTRPHFKGTLQDIRLSNGSETRLVQPFPLENVTAVVLPGDDLGNVQTHNVLEGTVSDDTCSSAPCMNGGTCNVTWNDFECACPIGYKGKTCEDREYCAIFECPEGSLCANLDDGYECLANLTLSGANSSLTFSPRFRRPPVTLVDLQITYRSQVGGVLLHSHSSGAGVRVSLGAAGVVVQQDNGTTTTATFTSNTTLDGAWHDLKVTLNPTVGLQVLLDDTPLLGGDTTVIVDFKDLVLRGEIMLGGSPLDSVAHNLLDPTLASSPAPAPTSPAQAEGGGTTHMFRGCLGPSRVAGVLLPFFSPQELTNNSAENQFYRREEQNTAVGCTVCYQEECVNDGFCSSPAEVYSCSCPEGFEGERCEVNIDECVGHQCLNGAICVDGISQYTCSCQPGYTGQWCEEDIDECADNPCQNGGECRNEIARFVCLCPPDFIGVDCSELKVKNCSTVMCLNGGTCNDIMNPETGVADDFECSCAFGYTGDNCEETEDFCAMNRIVCLHGTCNLTFRDQGWECLCSAGWEGALCQEEVNECLSDPCKNGGICTDEVNGYNCTCLEGWEGQTCEVDINECALRPCQNEGECVNLLGTFECECSELHCGQTCSLPSPCLGFNCTENGECVERCDEEVDEEPFAMCHCDEGWAGDDCATAHVQFPTDLELAIIVGCVVGLMLIIAIVGLTVFLMMAKKKRQTRGTYSPSRQEFYSPRVEMGNMMKPPPEERLI